MAPYPDGLDYHRAEAVLRALGLDDLDALAERVWCDATFGPETFSQDRLRAALVTALGGERVA
jgi:hypothetical protein